MYFIITVRLAICIQIVISHFPYSKVGRLLENGLEACNPSNCQGAELVLLGLLFTEKVDPTGRPFSFVGEKLDLDALLLIVVSFSSFRPIFAVVKSSCIVDFD